MDTNEMFGDGLKNNGGAPWNDWMDLLMMEHVRTSYNFVTRMTMARGVVEVWSQPQVVRMVMPDSVEAPMGLLR